MEAAQIDGHHGLILQSCYALLLFGCPNCGLAVESLRPMVKSQANSKLIEDLDKGSNFLRRHNHFWKFYMPEHTRVISIYETQPTASVEPTSTSSWKRTGKPVLMVNRESAIHATPDGRQDDIFSIDADHSNIVKFDNNSCQDYINVRSKLVILVGEAQAVISQRCKEGEILILDVVPGGTQAKGLTFGDSRGIVARNARSELESRSMDPCSISGRQSRFHSPPPPTTVFGTVTC